MKKTHDTTIIIAALILILFAVFTIIYAFKGNSIRNNSVDTNNNFNADSNVNSSIYSEHNHDTNENNNITNVKKIYEEIATYTTNIYDKDKNRIHNIKLACKRLDGHIIAAGEEFSFNNKMGNMGQADGYKKALGFDSNGNKIKVFGGGICQISSTLYNSVLIANLKVTERHAHSRRVYYVPKDKDATVFSGGADFKFINNTASNIMVCTSTDGYTVTVSLKQEKVM